MMELNEERVAAVQEQQIQWPIIKQVCRPGFNLTSISIEANRNDRQQLAYSSKHAYFICSHLQTGPRLALQFKLLEFFSDRRRNLQNFFQSLNPNSNFYGLTINQANKCRQIFCGLPACQGNLMNQPLQFPLIEIGLQCLRPCLIRTSGC